MQYKNFNLPDKLFYNKDSSWIKIEEKSNDTIVTLGIIEPAAKSVEEFLFVKLPESNETIKKGDIYVSLEAMKWTGHLKSPVSGEILEVNEPVYDEPETINKDPYNTWICKIKISNKEELNELNKAEEITEWLNSIFD